MRAAENNNWNVTVKHNHNENVSSGFIITFIKPNQVRRALHCNRGSNSCGGVVSRRIRFDLIIMNMRNEGMSYEHTLL